MSSNGADPFAQEADDFRAEVDPEHVALLGTRGDTIIPSQGLVVVAGQPGVGKTTVVADLVWHLASGMPWLGMDVPRPLNVLLVENEGPVHMFRAKIETKSRAWTHDRPGRVWIQTWRWGLFSLADDDARRALGAWCHDNPVDVIVGDPLGSLGPVGAGSPEDTRRFVLSLLALDLPVAWLFVHHFRKDPTSSEVDQLSGAWAGHLDSLLLVKPTRRRDEVRLSFPKTRWTDQQRPPLILGYVRNTQGFDVLGEEGDVALAVHALAVALKGSEGMTTTEVAKAAGLRRVAAEEGLKGNPHMFQLVPGADVGRPKASKGVWQLVPEGGTTTTPHGNGESGQVVLTFEEGTSSGDNLSHEAGQPDAPKGGSIPLPVPPSPRLAQVVRGGGTTYPPTPPKGEGGPAQPRPTEGGDGGDEWDLF